MKKFVIFLVVLMIAVPAYAREKKDSAKTTVRAEDNSKLEEMRKKVEEKKKELNGSEWKVNLTLGGKPEGEDVMTFQNGQVASKMFHEKGYPTSNYTVSVPEGSDMATWETMQTNPKGGVVFMRGEWKEGLMRGVISQQLEEGKSKDYNFASSGKEAVPPTTSKEEPKKDEPVKEKSSEKTEKSSKEVAAFKAGTTKEAGK